MKTYRPWTIFAVLLLTLACSGSTDLADSAETVMALEREWSDRFQAKDVDWIAALHASDARQLPPGAPIVVGGDAIRTAWQTMADTQGLVLNWEPVFVSVSGDFAYDIGKGIFTTPDGVTRQVKYVVIWERRDGEWKIVVDMFNFDE